MTPHQDAAATYAARIDAVQEQRSRLIQPRTGGGDRWANRASFFRLDPRRELDANTAAIVSLVSPLDTVIDIGGGAGRVSLPIALRAAEVMNIDPSAAMREQFDESAREAGIANARVIDGSWPAAADGLDADVVMAANVTYFVRDIVPFLEAMDRAAERLAVVTVWSVPPPDRARRLFEIVYEEPQAPTPSHVELLAVLWELDIVADVRVLPDRFRGFRDRFPNRDEAIAAALTGVDATDVPGAAARIEGWFDELFRRDGDEFVATWLSERSREMVISWTPRSAESNGG